MDKISRLFLEAMSASLKNSKVTWDEEITAEEWSALFVMANVHNVLPMIYEAVYDCPAIRVFGPGFTQGIKRSTIQSVMIQTMKTSEFQALYEYLVQNGISPCVVKGIVCRNLYPSPDMRMSSDEDVFIPEEQFGKCHKLLIDFGMVMSDPELDIYKAYEVPYSKVGSPLYIELHKHLFPPESEAYGDLNTYFDGVHARKDGVGLVEEEINGTKFLTLNPTSHLFYLICHSYKHFLHSGFGLRQVCDIDLYAKCHGAEINWDKVLENLREIRADLFAVAMFEIGWKYLGFEKSDFGLSEAWENVQVDEGPMLDDLLKSGVYGQADMSRKHSSNITLNAVIADKRGKKASGGRLTSMVKSVCLPLDSMKKRFPYLEKFPILLPVAWAQRVIEYKKETAGHENSNNAAKSLKIGNERVELLRKYGIIK